MTERNGCAMKHPRNHAYGRFDAISQPASPTNPLITIARQDGEIRAMRRKLDAIEGLMNDANFRPKTLGSLLVLFYAIWQVLQERQS